MATNWNQRIGVLAMMLVAPSLLASPCDGTLGDINADEMTTIVDVQCSIVTLLWSLGGQLDDSPSCLGVPLDDVDLDCAGGLTVSDVQLTIQVTLGIDLVDDLDGDGNGCPDACESPVAAAVLLSELLYDADGPDTETFVELSGEPGTSLDGYELVGINGNGGGDYQSILLSGAIGPTGYFVVASPTSGPSLLAAADQLDAGVNYQNGPDSVQLRLGAEVVDAVGYGAFDPADVFAGEGSPAPDGSNGASIGRNSLGTDTDDNAADFQVYEEPTPGAPNGPAANASPTAALACPFFVETGATTTLDASASADSDGVLVSFAFDFGDGGSVSGSESVVEYTYLMPGTFEVALVVTDDGGATATASCEIEVFGEPDSPPIALFSAVPVGATSVLLDASLSSDDTTEVGALEFRWDFDSDGDFDTPWSTEASVVHDFGAAGLVDVSLEVRDEAGQISTTSQSVEIAPTSFVAGVVTTTTWSGTVVITGDVVVPAGEVLTVAPGTVVAMVFDDVDGNGIGDFGITIDGAIDVQGSEVAPVVFTAFGDDNAAGSWEGLTLAGQSASLSHVTVEYATTCFRILTAASIDHFTARECQVGLGIHGGDPVEAFVGTIENNTVHGVDATNGASSLSDVQVRQNALMGVVVRNFATLNLADSTVSENGQAGILYADSGTGVATRNNITSNGWEGVRITYLGAGPAPSVTVNNIFGNASGGALEFASIGISVSSSTSQTGSKLSATYSAPPGRPIGFVRAAYSTTSGTQMFGKVLSSAGDLIVWSGGSYSAQWSQVGLGGVATLTGQVIDNRTDESNSVSLLNASYFEPNADYQVTVMTNGAVADLTGNYFAAFPDAAPAVRTWNGSSADIAGAIGEPYDDSWTASSVVGGLLEGDHTWSGTLFVVEDVTLAPDATLTIEPGTTVFVTTTDANGDGIGDVDLRFQGAVTALGTSDQPILMTSAEETLTASDWGEIEFGGTTTLEHVEIGYGHTTVLAGAGAKSLSNVAVVETGSDGLVIDNAADVELSDILVSNPGGTGIDQLGNVSSLLVNGCTITDAGLHGIRVAQGQASIQNCEVLSSGQFGLRVDTATAHVEHCTFHNGLAGVGWFGSANGSLLSSDIRFTAHEAVTIGLGQGGDPNVLISGNNFVENALISGAETLATPASVSSGMTATGLFFGPTWSTPSGGSILAAKAEFAVFGGSASGMDGYLFQPGSDDPVVDLSVGNTTYELTGNSYLSGFTNALIPSVGDGRTTKSSVVNLKSVSYRVSGLHTELSVITNTGTIDATGNYWGVFPNVSEVVHDARGSSVNTTGFVGIPFPDAGPQ